MAFKMDAWDWNTRPDMRDGMPQTFIYKTVEDTIDEVKAAKYFDSIIEPQNLPAYAPQVSDLIDVSAVTDSTKDAPQKRILLEITAIDLTAGTITVSDF